MTTMICLPHSSNRYFDLLGWCNWQYLIPHWILPSLSQRGFLHISGTQTASTTDAKLEVQNLPETIGLQFMLKTPKLVNEFTLVIVHFFECLLHWLPQNTPSFTISKFDVWNTAKSQHLNVTSQSILIISASCALWQLLNTFEDFMCLRQNDNFLTSNSSIICLIMMSSATIGSLMDKMIDRKRSKAIKEI